jgi:hypothetical protein
MISVTDSLYRKTSLSSYNSHIRFIQIHSLTSMANTFIKTKILNYIHRSNFV